MSQRAGFASTSELKDIKDNIKGKSEEIAINMRLVVTWRGDEDGVVAGVDRTEAPESETQAAVRVQAQSHVPAANVG